MTTNTESAAGQGALILDELYGQDHVIITASLKLANGRFLQPTGFPDIDACIYRDGAGRRWCLVESEQSMANRLEAVCMRSPGVWADDLKGLPLIAVRNRAGDLLTTNLTEPHRIASSYVLEGMRAGANGDMRALFERRLGLQQGGDFWPLDRRADLERLVFALDPAALLHGFQFVQWKFVGLRQARLLHARLEAELTEDPEVHYGMVKWDAIEPESSREERANKGQSIAAKSRIVPKSITATFEIDLLALKSLSLGEDRRRFLFGLALWKIGAFLANRASFDPRSRSTGPSLRLRADCYLTCEEPISWTGSSAEGKTTAAHLMSAKPAGLGQPYGPSFTSDPRAHEHDGEGTDTPTVTFHALIDKLLDRGSEGTKTLYDGPLVEVTYEPKPKQEKKGGGKGQPANAGNEESDDPEK